MSDATTLVVVITVAFLAAGLVKGVMGMGLPTVAMGMLGLVMAPVTAAAILVVPTLVTNLWQLFAGPALGALLRRTATMMLGIFVGAFFGIGVLTGESAFLAEAALGGVLALYGVIGLAAPRFVVPRSQEYWLSPSIGLLTGLLGGATGIFVIPAVPYLSSLGLDRDDLIQALGLSFTVSVIALGLALSVTGQFQRSEIAHSFVAVIPALAGMFIGQHVRNRLQPAAFRKWFFIGLILLGLYMLARALVG